MSQLNNSGDLVHTISDSLSLLNSMLQDHRFALDIDVDSEELAIAFLEATLLQLELMVERNKFDLKKQTFLSPSSKHASKIQEAPMPQDKKTFFARLESPKKLNRTSNLGMPKGTQTSMNRIAARGGHLISQNNRSKEPIESECKTSRVRYDTSFDRSNSPGSLRYSHREMRAFPDQQISPQPVSKLGFEQHRTPSPLKQRYHFDSSVRSVFGSSAQSDLKEAPRLNFLKKRKVQKFLDVGQVSLDQQSSRNLRAKECLSKHQEKWSQSIVQEESLRITKFDTFSQRMKMDMSRIGVAFQKPALPGPRRGFLSVRENDYSILVPGYPIQRDSPVDDQNLIHAARVGDGSRDKNPVRTSFLQSSRSREKDPAELPNKQLSPRLKKIHKSLLIELGIKNINRKL